MTALAAGVRRRWELWFLALSLAVFFPTVLYGVLLASPDPLVGAARGLSAELESRLIQPPAPLPPAAPVMRQIAAACTSPGEAPAGGDWVYYRRPEIVVTVLEVPPPPPPPPFRFLPPVVDSAEAVPGRVVLAWRHAGGNDVPSTGYHVHRRRAGEDAFTRVTTEPVRETSFADATVEPKAAYEYAVSAVTDDARVKGGESARSGVRGVRVPDSIRLELKGGLRVQDRNGTIATVRVCRFHDGRWWEKDYAVQAGDAIGRPERVRHAGRTVEVDFTTGRTVRSVEPVEARGAGGPKTAWKATLDGPGAAEVLTTR